MLRCVSLEPWLQFVLTIQMLQASMTSFELKYDSFQSGIIPFLNCLQIQYIHLIILKFSLNCTEMLSFMHGFYSIMFFNYKSILHRNQILLIASCLWTLYYICDYFTKNSLMAFSTIWKNGYLNILNNDSTKQDKNIAIWKHSYVIWTHI